MSTRTQTTIDARLKSYLADAEYWTDACGDTHETLATRQALAGQTLSAVQLDALHEADAQFIGHLGAVDTAAQGFDIAMLRDLVAFIHAERAYDLKHRPHLEQKS